MFLGTSIALLLAGTSAGQTSEEEFYILNKITMHAPEIDSSEFGVAEEFAKCMSMPRFPTAGEYEGVEWKCSHEIPSGRSVELDQLLESIRLTIQDHPGSEATLELTGNEA